MTNNFESFLSLEHNQAFIWHDPDYGPIADISRLHGVYFLFEIPAFEPYKRIFDSNWSKDEFDLLEKTILEFKEKYHDLPF